MTSPRLRSLLVLGLFIAACDNPGSAPTPTEAHDHVDTPTNRVAIGPAVRSNLGITFAQATYRPVQDTLRLPGRFEYRPNAVQAWDALLAGRVHLAVTQFDTVTSGDTLYWLDSPAWRTLQQSLANELAAMDTANAALTSLQPRQQANSQRQAAAREAITLWQDRLDKLQAIRDAGGGRTGDVTQAQASLADARGTLAEAMERQAQLAATHASALAQAQSAGAQVELHLDNAAALTGFTAAQLLERIPFNGGIMPRWRTIDRIDIKADRDGVVAEQLATDGQWLDSHAPVLRIVQPASLRVHAAGLQSDLASLTDGLAVTIVPATGAADGAPMTGTLQVGIGGDADDRTIDLFVTPDSLAPWARAGVAAQIEVVLRDNGGGELAVPLAAVQTDGLAKLLFRRNPANKDEVIRIDADLGRNDGRWVEVLSGLADGDEVVVDGGYQLMLATSSTATKGGHFHADGTWHEGEH